MDRAAHHDQGLWWMYAGGLLPQGVKDITGNRRCGVHQSRSSRGDGRCTRSCDVSCIGAAHSEPSLGVLNCRASCPVNRTSVIAD